MFSYSYGFSVRPFFFAWSLLHALFFYQLNDTKVIINSGLERGSTRQIPGRL